MPRDEYGTNQSHCKQPNSNRAHRSPNQYPRTAICQIGGIFKDDALRREYILNVKFYSFYYKSFITAVYHFDKNKVNFVKKLNCLKVFFSMIFKLGVKKKL